MNNNSERKNRFIFQNNKTLQTRPLCSRSAILLARNWRLPIKHRVYAVRNVLRQDRRCWRCSGEHIAAYSGRPEKDVSGRRCVNENTAVLPHIRSRPLLSPPFSDAVQYWASDSLLFRGVLTFVYDVWIDWLYGLCLSHALKCDTATLPKQTLLHNVVTF